MAKPLKALKEVINNLFSPHATGAYPHVKKETDPKFRARIEFKPEPCIGCQLCVRNCPANAIKIIQINPADKPVVGPDGKVTPVKRKFKAEIDLGRCIFCAQCVDSCLKGAISSSTGFELACFDKKDLKDEFKHPEEN